MVYKLATPWDGGSSATNYPGCGPIYSPPVPIDPTDYQLGFNGNIPFGTNGLCTVNPSNGVATIFARAVGNYAVAIDLYEYRNGVQLSVTRLDLQILVINCGINAKPSISTTSKKYTIFAGDKLCFNVTGKDKDNQNLSLDGFGDLLTGANGFVGNRQHLPPLLEIVQLRHSFVGRLHVTRLEKVRISLPQGLLMMDVHLSTT